MKILIIRHLESEKNLRNSFASDNNLEELTENGMMQGLQLAKNIHQYIFSNSLKVKNIYSANSKRAISTANLISNRTGSSIITYDALNSIKHSSFSGMEESEIEKIDPEFIYQLKLYRIGLFNSYQIKHHEGNESVYDFEKRVNHSLQIILSNTYENFKILILHRSSILACLFYFVRTYYNFPYNYYGYVEIDYGHICLLEIESDKLKILAINQSHELLNP